MSTLDLVKALIRCPSTTPQDAGCQSIIRERLERLRFHIEPMRFNEVDNLWARHGTQSPLLVFAGHTDVVPTGPLDAWITDPFEPSIRGGFLYGRGAADMKSGLAAMIVATELFLQKYPNYGGSIGFLITSDEEGPTNQDGTKRVVETLMERQETIDYCIVGEASADELVGDQIRIGRRGSLSGKLTIYGKQGHVAFPDLANNPIFRFAPALQELALSQWDKGNEFFPATTFQVSNIHAGTGAQNVIPGSLEVQFNFRFGNAVTVDELKNRVTNILKKYAIDFDLTWDISGHPFLTKPGKLITATKAAIQKITTLTTRLSTGGGTSDARFIAPTGTEVIELGPVNASIHQANEHIRVSDLDILTQIYEQILENIFIR